MWPDIEDLDRSIRDSLTTATAPLVDNAEKICWAVAFSFLLVFATVGNSLVSWFIIGIYLLINY